MRRVIGSVFVLFCVVATAAAQYADEAYLTREEFETQLGYQSGSIRLADGVATIDVPASFRFLGADGSRRLLTEGWGNPPGSADDVIGMLIPADASPLTDEGWGIVIMFDESGYVKDEEAASIDYSKVLKEMQKATRAENEDRQKQGFEPIELVGWAEPPHYDAVAHKLYWAKELAFGSDPGHTLNYCIRILGRRGVLHLNAVAAMDHLPTIHERTPEVLAAVHFNDGHRYTDYVHGTDKVAEYGVGGLILGVAAAKVGFFKALLVAILALKKVLIVGVLAVFAFLRKLFGRGQRTTIPPTS